MTSAVSQKALLTPNKRVFDSQAVLFVSEALSAAISTDTSHGTQLKMANWAKIIWGGVWIFWETNQSASGISPVPLYIISGKLAVTVWSASSWVQVAKEEHVSFPFLTQPKESSHTLTHTEGNDWAQFSYFLKNRMAMTKMMIRITANTGPITHSISGCSWIWLSLIWIGSE